MHGDDFAFLARMLRRRSGLVLTPDKMGLTVCRLEPVMRRFGFKAIDSLMHELRLGHDTLAAAITEAMTVNETSFFRDAVQFARFRDQVLPPILRARDNEKRLRIWSAACAAGQEAYSIAMVLDALGLAAEGWIVDLIATDLSGEAIARAEKGHYSPFEVQRGLGPEQLAYYFVKDENGLTLIERLRRMVTFRRFNLLDSFGWLDDLDIVFCRNVLIYFDHATKQAVLERIAETLVGDGVLLLGDAEMPSASYSELPGGKGIYGKAASTAVWLSAAV